MVTGKHSANPAVNRYLFESNKDKTGKGEEAAPLSYAVPKIEWVIYLRLAASELPFEAVLHELYGTLFNAFSYFSKNHIFIRSAPVEVVPMTLDHTMFYEETLF